MLLVVHARPVDTPGNLGSLVRLLHLAEFKIDGGLASEHLDQGLQTRRIDIDLGDRGMDAREGSIGDDHVVAVAGPFRLPGPPAGDQLQPLVTGAVEQGIIIADTKFEFGRGDDGEIVLIDEVLTPDSSRFWPAERYGAGRGQQSLDKQPLRDYLEGLVERGTWDRNPPPPDLPSEVVHGMSQRYREVFARLTGTELDGVDLATWGRAP